MNMSSMYVRIILTAESLISMICNTYYMQRGIVMGDYNNPNDKNNQPDHWNPNQPNNQQDYQQSNGQPNYQQPQQEQQPNGQNFQQQNPNGYQQYNQNPYQTNQYQYGQYQQYQTPVQPQSNGMAVGALICGILGILLSCCLWYISIPLSIVGLVLGILVLKKKKGGKSLAIIGIVLCAISILIGIFVAIVVIAVFTNPEFSSMYDEILREFETVY